MDGSSQQSQCLLHGTMDAFGLKRGDFGLRDLTGDLLGNKPLIDLALFQQSAGEEKDGRGFLVFLPLVSAAGESVRRQFRGAAFQNFQRDRTAVRGAFTGDL